MIPDDEVLGGRLVAIGQPLSIPEWAENDLRLDTWDRHVIAALIERAHLRTEATAVTYATPSELLDRVRGPTVPSEVERIHESIKRLRRFGIVSPVTGGGWLVRPVRGLPKRPPALSFFEECIEWAERQPAEERGILLDALRKVRDDETEGSP